MKCAQNLRFLVDQNPNNLKLLRPPDPLLQRSTIGLNPSPINPTFMYLSQKHVLTNTSTDIIVKSLPGLTQALLMNLREKVLH